MIHHFPVKRLRTAFCLAMIVAVTACGGGSGSGDGGGTPSNNDKSLSSVEDKQSTIVEDMQSTIMGSVGDGPIINATITVKDANGRVVLTTTGNAQANYSLSVPADTLLPLKIIATGGTDIVSNETPEFTLVAVVTDSGDQTANLNPFSTFVVKIAQALPGGLTAANIATAKAYVLSQLNFGFDDTRIADPIFTPIDTNNVANMVKSSEALAEMIRRAHAEMKAEGSNLTQDEVIEYLARDLTDGKIDGLGTGLVDLRLAAMANIATGQVLVESLRNELQVGGKNVRVAMDNAIKTILPQATMTTADVEVTERMLNQVELAIDVAQEMAPSARLTTLAQQLSNITPGSKAAQIKVVLSADGRDTVDSVLKMIGSASNDKLEDLNRVVRNNNHNVGTGATPLAQNDSGYSTDQSTAITIPVLDNDSGLDDGPVQASLIQSPSNGTVEVLSNNSIRYTPNGSYLGSDSFVYKVTDVDGDMATATVTLQVVCGACATDVMLNVSWNANPGDENVTSYSVYYGNSAGAVNTFYQKLTASDSNFDLNAPAIVLNAGDDLGLQTGDTICFKVSAYNLGGESGKSMADCETI